MHRLPAQPYASAFGVARRSDPDMSMVTLDWCQYSVPSELSRMLSAMAVRLRSRRVAAGLPKGKTFEVWDPALSVVPAPTQAALCTPEWVDDISLLAVRARCAELL